MCICKSCGKVIETDFYFCPWCGESRIKNNTKDDNERRAAKLRENQKELHQQKIEKLDDDLAELEKELSAMVLCAQLAR